MRRPLVTAVALALASLSPASFAAAAAGTPAAAARQVTTQLPRDVRPLHYAIAVIPHAETLSYDGRVAIDLEVLAETSAITLNQLDMAFTSVVLADADGRKTLKPAVSLDNAGQTATFGFDAPLAPGRYTLDIVYSGKIGTQANGLFALDYATEAGRKRALFTQFENSDARRFVPSWDEPLHKATFDLSVTVPAAQMAVSNMPVAERKDLGDGRVQVRFERSPKMSTYLLFFGLGEFDRLAETDNGVEIGVITQAGKAEQARFAMESSKAILREFNDYFGVPYPLPKLDNIAAPGRSQFFSAMENWGAIFTFEHTLLLDPAIATVSDEQRIFSVAAHEIAHQWFGNLVTMEWWDDLWLNEGFATWLEGRTTAKLHPEWNSALNAVYTREGAMNRDAVASTHPVIQHVETVEQASQAFDAITYSKGSAVINMLEAYVGADAWREGVRNYIRAHAYGSTATDDLWAQIDKAAPDKQLLKVAHDFTRQPGVPLLKVSASCDDGKTTVHFTQGEFTRDRPGKPALAWNVPVIARLVGGEAASTLVSAGEGRLELPGCGAVLVNAGQSGYYRSLYAPAQFKALAAGFAQLPTIDQLGVLNDVWALGMAGEQPVSDYLDLASSVPLQAAPEIWQNVAGILGSINGMYGGDGKRRAAFRKYAIARLSPVFQQLGWESREGDPAPVKQLRTGLIGTLASLGDAKVIAEAKRRFAASQTDPAALPAELRRTVLGIVARNADAATWDTLHALAKQETSSLLRDQYYALLANPRRKVLAQRALDMALTDEPGATNSAAMIRGVANVHPELAFDFAVAHREQVDQLVDSTSRSRYYPGLAAGSSKPEMIAKVNAFAEAHIAPEARRDAQTAVGGIETRIRQRAERLPEIEAWLKQNAR